MQLFLKAKSICIQNQLYLAKGDSFQNFLFGFGKLISYFNFYSKFIILKEVDASDIKKSI